MGNNCCTNQSGHDQKEIPKRKVENIILEESAEQYQSENSLKERKELIVKEFEKDIDKSHVFSSEHVPSLNIAKVSENPQIILPKNLDKVLEIFGEFVYNSEKEEFKNLPTLPPYEFENGAVYQGQWKNGERHGRGKQNWLDSSLYEGNWEANKANGKGRLIHGDGDVYEGEWKDDKAHGYGVYMHLDGAKYELLGYGEFKWEDGRCYLGNYVDDKKHGYGEFSWSDGRIYKGEWFEGKQHGRGKYIGSSGKEREGEWQDGKKIKWIKKEEAKTETEEKRNEAEIRNENGERKVIEDNP